MMPFDVKKKKKKKIIIIRYSSISRRWTEILEVTSESNLPATFTGRQIKTAYE